MGKSHKIGLLTVAYNEARFIEPFLKHIPEWVDEKLVLVSNSPWQGEPEEPDGTDLIAERMGATVIVYDWPTEQDQRNAGLDYLYDCDWVIVLDPDEFLDNDNWGKLKEFIKHAEHSAYVCDHQLTYWKSGYVADPARDYNQIIMVKPNTRFTDKRVVGCPWAYSPIVVNHFSWARNDRECWSKISHYAHAKDFDIKKWYDEVWLKWQPGMEDVHPITPETLHKLIPAELPPELEGLNLWP